MAYGIVAGYYGTPMGRLYERGCHAMRCVLLPALLRYDSQPASASAFCGMSSKAGLAPWRRRSRRRTTGRDGETQCFHGGSSSCQASSDPPVRLSYGLSQGVASQRLPGCRASTSAISACGAARRPMARPGSSQRLQGSRGRRRWRTGSARARRGAARRGDRRRGGRTPQRAVGPGEPRRLDLPVLKEALRRVRPCRRPPTSAPRRFVRGTRVRGVRGAGRRGRGPAVLFEPSSRRCPVNCN